MKSIRLKACLVSVAALVVASASVVAATLEGQHFDDRVRLVNQELMLNGLGLRAVFFIKGYVAGLYLPEKATSLREIAGMPGAKRLQLRMLRKAEAEDFIEALVEGIEENSSKSELVQLNARIRQLQQTIQAIGPSAVGDTINFDFAPGLGTTLTFNGAKRGSLIEGADFYNAVLKIFVGDHPVDERLKAGLLGK